MTRIFISYSRVDTAFVERLYYRLQQMRPTFSIWYDQAPHGLLGGDIWWDEIMRAVAASDIFIYVLSNESVQSKYCQAEFQEARRLQKRIITIQARDRTRLTAELRDIQYVDMKNGVDDPEALARLSGALDRQLSQIKKSRPLWQPRTPKPAEETILTRRVDAPEVDTPTLQLPIVERQGLPRQRGLSGPWSTVIAAVITGVFALVAAYIVYLALNGNEDEKTPLPTQTKSVVAVPTETTVMIDTPGPTPTATDTIIPTATHTPTLPPTPDPLQAAYTPVAHNADWTPVTQEFNGVTMVLVPAGCFMMGSENGDSDERPVHEVCFEEPFWIDRTEVTNGQFAAFNGQAIGASLWTEDSRPRQNITWFEAQAFCKSRGGRLPTEAEWEYAARGPEGWVYPWGNTFVTDNVVYGGEFGSQTAEVGSRPGGTSWVGALDMSGNVWEWTSTIYQSYPYQASDGREDNSDTGSMRVLRGGAGDDPNTANLRAANRDRNDPDVWPNTLGFRCARSR